MHLKEYTQLALRTENIPEGLTGDARNHYRLSHAALGLASEFKEVTADDANLLEEIGDYFWYLNLLCDALGVALDDVEIDYLQAGSDLFVDIGSSVGEITNLVKRHIFYGKDIEQEDILAAAAQLFRDLYELLCDADHTLDECLDANILKLEKRYPNLHFEQERALNRNLQAEKEALLKEA